MGCCAPAGEVYQAGTLSGNPLAVAAGLATLELLDEAAYVRLAAIDRASGRRAARGGGGLPGAGRPAPGLLTVFFTGAPGGDHPDYSDRGQGTAGEVRPVADFAATALPTLARHAS